jgi:dihydrodipicolinate synthase/N-acetylneuraminate lyase
MEVIRALHDRVPGLVAVKDDVLGDFGMQMCTTVHDRWAVVSSGYMYNCTLQIPYGVDGYLCLFMSFKPEISWKYWNSIKTGNYDTAWKLIKDFEMPIRAYQNTVEGGQSRGSRHF